MLLLYAFDLKSSEYMFKTTPNLTKIFLGIAFGIFTTMSLNAQEIPTDESVVAAGEATFNANCTQCHRIWEVRIGPALNGVSERRSVEWLNSWIKNSQALIASGDEEAVALYEEYDKTLMQAFPFSDDQVMEILAYIKAETAKGPPAEDTTATTAEGEGDSISSSYLMSIIIILVVVLGLAVVALIIAARTLVRHLKDAKGLDEAEQEVVSQQFDVSAFLKSNNFVGLVVFVFTILVLKTLIDGAFTIGVQQGYQPEQPIAFSHEIHAGQYEIDCQYCHTGVNKSKSANIPSPNICMNCHTQVKTESEEIQKIYAAIDYDPETKTYGTNTKPIEWVRIHNLPDLAYFNHSQHVNVADLECETCHGPIKEMEVVYQYSSLTMGWCINCHRDTDVNTKGNEYYDKLVKLHSEQSKEPMKVEDIGGLECAKCHY
ncbi:quinol:cytochrome c oxidoreductase pentaheme cytochrome subunit [Ekhidna lutea]|uniref:Quinol:cytochrome c oxidoreductase pentaheme cytochrome subunit n=1 Tax=Ekhidna lutea TaxID=447679 RepID=A0A239HC61_EKHLU|nr:cytochrome c3 family protein [Ekhidna lutea]SNS78967.1 quinol:cytochrome c oxidoreductase pentaheme cytochrome subunit [Ekhidna lutea]